MKYPQLVSMPSTVQDWLDEQLEARGIDAVVYTRYIFSLLQRDTLDLSDDLLTLSSGKSKEVGRRGRKRGRREEYWHVWDCEQLKRSAAVECLMSASDQKFGIEKLVDELCAKLKEIQSEGANHSHSSPSLPSVSEPQSQSPSDLVQKYYAAFPPLSRSSDANIKAPVLSSDLSSAWGSKKILANSFRKNKLQINTSHKSGKTLGATNCIENKENQGRNDCLSNNMRSRNQVKDKDWSYNVRKELVCPFSWSFTGVWSNETTDLNAFAPSVKAIATGWRVSKYNKQNQGLQDTRTLEDPLSMEGELWNISSCHVYEHQMQNELTLDAGNQSEKLQNYESESGQNVDENLAQLIAKFDHSIEALWSPESRSENSSPSSKLVGYATPLENTFINSVEQENSGSKNLLVAASNNSFIRCGTNIKSSIWSSQPSDTVPLATDESKFDLVEHENVSSCFVSDIENNGESQYIDENKQDVDKFDAVINSTRKVVGSKSNNLGDKSCKKNVTLSNCFRFLKPGSNMAAESMKTEVGRTVWNKFEGFSSVAPALPLEECIPAERSNNIWNRRWPTDESSHMVTNNFPHYNMFPNCHVQSQNCSSFSDGTFGTLNHNREDSSFTEVVPKQSFCSFTSDNKYISSQASTHSDDIYSVASETRKSNEVADNVKDKEEEDLLTSTRTHFRPIRQESPDSHNNNTGCYADGTTFVIPNSLESVPFKRSESGALYLETDLGIETPKKYMEYKEKELYNVRHKVAKSPDNVTSVGKDFVPKFRVHQIEKCCQTEASDENVTSDEEVDTKRSRQELKESEFYFPGDEHFAEKIVNCLEIDDDHIDHTLESKLPFSTLITNDTKLTPLLKQSDQYQALRLSENLSVSSEEMSYRWSAAVKNCCKCNRNNAAWKAGWQKESHGLPVSQDEIWGSSGSAVQSHAWYDIWSGTFDSTGDTCKKCAGAEHTAPQDMNPEHVKLREELSLDGEQLLSDLRYMQHLYQGSDSNDSGAGCTEKMQCLSPSSETEASNDIQLYDDSDFGGSRVAPMHCSPSQNDVDGKENESFEGFGATSSRRMQPNKVLLSIEVGAENKMNERPFSLKMPAKDRKRRHSGCLRQVSDNQHFEAPNTGFLAGREPSAAMGCRLRTIPDTTRLKGSCVPRSLRPVTL